MSGGSCQFFLRRIKCSVSIETRKTPLLTQKIRPRIVRKTRLKKKRNAVLPAANSVLENVMCATAPLYFRDSCSWPDVPPVIYEALAQCATEPERSPPKGEKVALSLYCILGVIRGKGTGLQKNVHEHTQAYSPAHSKLNITKPLKNLYKEEIFTGNCDVEPYTKIHPQNNSS